MVQNAAWEKALATSFANVALKQVRGNHLSLYVCTSFDILF